MAFVPRFSLAGITDTQTCPWYLTNGNWFYANGYYYPAPNGNCTWYAYGRYAEVRNGFANLPLGNAGTWYDNATAFPRGDFSQGALPQLGAIVCFKSLSGTRPGHITVVEQINSDGSIIVSQSGYQSPVTTNTHFWTARVYPSNQYRESWYTAGGRDYYCQGFIYQYGVIPPVPPTPVPVRAKKMPLWFYLRRNLTK